MISSVVKKTFQKTLIILADVIAIYLSLIIAFYTRASLEGWLTLTPLGHGLSFYIMKWWIVAVILMLIGYNGGYENFFDFWDELLILFKSIFVSFLVLWVILSLQKEAETVSRIIITSMFIYILIVVPSLRFILKTIIFKIFDLREHACLLGSNEHKDFEFLKIFNSNWYSGYRIMKIIKPDYIVEGYNTCFIPLRCANEELIKNIKTKFKRLIMVSELAGFSFMNTQIKTFLSKNIMLITTDSGLLSPQKMIFKRCLDVLFSCCLLLLFLPLFVLISIIIKIDSQGPIFFRHKRVGKDFKEFIMLKFRTMYVNCEPALKEYLKKHPEAIEDLEKRNKIKDDPRITRFGKFLRRSSLDELPQLLNVLKGDMSIIGPRPDSMDAVKNFLDEYKDVYSMVRPGMTGLWQVSGRSELTYDIRVKLDQLYILNWSLWLDFVIIIKTFKALFTGRGAY